MPSLTGYHEVYGKQQTYDSLWKSFQNKSPFSELAIPFGTLAHHVLTH